ncbi:hypothetical protein SAMN05216436_115128 [bacterium A37T11]|nr:hypothetical protein SAMN05216436_115128 [bacterium A37T11]
MRIILILCAGSVLFGACAISRHKESDQQTSATTAAWHAAERSLSLHDTILETRGLQLQQDRELLLYRESTHATDTGKRQQRTSLQLNQQQQSVEKAATATSQHDLQTSKYRPSISWWLCLAGGVLLVLGLGYWFVQRR